MQVRVFYSWQSDTDLETNKDFIEEALTQALDSLTEDVLLDIPARVDRDTKGLPGSPDFFSAIQEKIEGSSIFVADLTLVAQTVPRPGRPGRMQPNANVSIEYGIALEALGASAVIGIVNEAYGALEGLPSDIKRHIIRGIYSLTAGDPAKEPKKFQLAETLASEIMAIVEQTILQGLTPAAALVAKYFVEISPSGRDTEGLKLDESEIAGQFGLPTAQAREAVDTLLSREYVVRVDGAGQSRAIGPSVTLFQQFDKVWLHTNTMRVARKIAAQLVDRDQVQTAEISSVLGLTPRQLNPAILLLLRSNHAERPRNVDATSPFVTHLLWSTPTTRQFASGDWPPTTRPGSRG